MFNQKILPVLFLFLFVTCDERGDKKDASNCCELYYEFEVSFKLNEELSKPKIRLVTFSEGDKKKPYYDIIDREESGSYIYKPNFNEIKNKEQNTFLCETETDCSLHLYGYYIKYYKGEPLGITITNQNTAPKITTYPYYK